MSKVELVLSFIIYLLFFKSISIGSDFNFLAWIRYGREYRLWYSSRESFREYLERTGKRKGW